MLQRHLHVDTCSFHSGEYLIPGHSINIEELYGAESGLKIERLTAMLAMPPVWEYFVVNTVTPTMAQESLTWLFYTTKLRQRSVNLLPMNSKELKLKQQSAMKRMQERRRLSECPQRVFELHAEDVLESIKEDDPDKASKSIQAALLHRTTRARRGL